MDAQSTSDNAGAAAMPSSSYWSERATEIRAMSARTQSLAVRVILEDIATLYDVLARRAD
jgi:hypothetical protein